MKLLLLLTLALTFVKSSFAQQSVVINEPSEQCYQDLKTNLSEAYQWNDAQRVVTFRPLATLPSGNIQLTARIFQEAGDKKCKLVVGYDSPEEQAGLNAANSSFLFRNAHLIAGRIDSARKAREKDEKKKAKEQQQDKK
jgi:hypothetical protein